MSLFKKKYLIALILLLMMANTLYAQIGTEKGRPTVGIKYFHTDHIGSSTLTTDNSGSESSRFTYLPYGEVLKAASSGPDDMRAKFTGKELDADTDLYYFNARYYDPHSGRFTVADAGLGASEAHPAALNRYAYVGGNPITVTDPTGRNADGSPWEPPPEPTPDPPDKTGTTNGSGTTGYGDKAIQAAEENDEIQQAMDQIETTYGVVLEGDWEDVDIAELEDLDEVFKWYQMVFGEEAFTSIYDGMVVNRELDPIMARSNALYPGGISLNGNLYEGTRKDVMAEEVAHYFDKVNLGDLTIGFQETTGGTSYDPFFKLLGPNKFSIVLDRYKQEIEINIGSFLPGGYVPAPDGYVKPYSGSGFSSMVYPNRSAIEGFGIGFSQYVKQMAQAETSGSCTDCIIYASPQNQYYQSVIESEIKGVLEDK